MTILIYLIITILFIIISTGKYKLHPFLALLVAAIIMGILGGLDTSIIIKSISEGFGNTLKSIGIVIACGSIIGAFLEKTGGAKSIADFLLNLTGKDKSHLAVNMTGFFVSIPVFCDSGYVILSSLNNAINKKTGISLAVLGTSLAAGLYASHVFIPPTPGPLAASAIIGADVGLVLIFGFMIAVPVSLVGWAWSTFYCSKFLIDAQSREKQEFESDRKSPNVMIAILPIVIPIIFISLKSFIEHPSIFIENDHLEKVIIFLGNPIIALLMGVFIAMATTKEFTLHDHSIWVSSGLKSAGTIILITGAGGAFGNILRSTSLGDSISQQLISWEIGIFLPFLIAAFLKTAQGSSTVSIITTAAMIAPMLDSLGLSSEMGKVLVVLSIGAGAMTVSHLNDSYFWVVSQFSTMNTSTALRCHTVTTLLQGITGILLIQIFSLFIL